VQQRWQSAEFSGCTTQVAQRLLGCTLVRRVNQQLVRGIIVEVEAYLGANDPASHSARGITKRNAAMFGPAGWLYVYTIHRRHCLNVVTAEAGQGSAVLIRALEPIDMTIMIDNRRQVRAADHPAELSPREIATGPGRLCEALAVDKTLDGIDLVTSDKLWIETACDEVAQRTFRIGSSTRIGISKGGELMLRWFVDGHQLVSGKASDHSNGRNWRFLE
jgi:DNA-3-methyladenine glycosylase